MSATGLEIFDTTLQKTHVWLNDVMRELNVRDKRAAYLAMRAGLHALRDRLPVEEVAQLGAQLPMLVRGFYYEGWDPTLVPARMRQREEFLGRIALELNADERLNPEAIARAVFSVLSAHITKGELEDVKQALPSAVRELWPELTASS
jgi:uncharacterized protein (DUF2267 family)